MTTRQKTGLGIMLTGVIAGGVMIGWEVTPDWVALAIQPIRRRMEWA